MKPQTNSDGIFSVDGVSSRNISFRIGFRIKEPAFPPDMTLMAASGKYSYCLHGKPRDDETARRQVGPYLPFPA